MEKCKDIADWTTNITSDTTEQIKVFREQQQTTWVMLDKTGFIFNYFNL